MLILKKGKKFNEKLQNFKFIRVYICIYLIEGIILFQEISLQRYLTSLTFRNRLQSFFSFFFFF